MTRCAIIEQARGLEKMRFEQKRFYTTLNFFLDELNRWQIFSPSKPQDDRELDFQHLKEKLNRKTSHLPANERFLFNQIFDLFSLKNEVTVTDREHALLAKESEKNKENISIGFIGPLGVGKTTVAKSLINDLGARANHVTNEPYDKNPFWQLSQQSPEYMLRSQVYFLLSNILSDRNAKIKAGISVSDTSVFTDILMWVEWYHQIGRFSEEDYQTYHKLVTMLMPVIPKPDLLVALLPDSVDNLYRGISERQQPEQARTGELGFKKEDLKQQTYIVRALIKKITVEIGIPILDFTINPITTFKDRTLSYDYIYQIRNRLNLLKELLHPSPEDVADKIIKILAESEERQVILIHAESMFTGKTTALCLVAQKVGHEKLSAYQPRKAIRKLEQENAVLSRDNLALQARVVEDNSLLSLVEYIKTNINPKKKPYIFIDEIQLFIAEAENPQTAISALEGLRNLGFHVICDGIDYTFQEKPFTFMHRLINNCNENNNWKAVQMKTRCRYCEDDARGTRRIKIGIIASFNDVTYLAGDKEQYEPVCCKKHPSCAGQPPEFVRHSLPIVNEI